MHVGSGGKPSPRERLEHVGVERKSPGRATPHLQAPDLGSRVLEEFDEHIRAHIGSPCTNDGLPERRHPWAPPWLTTEPIEFVHGGKGVVEEGGRVHRGIVGVGQRSAYVSRMRVALLTIALLALTACGSGTDAGTGIPVQDANLVATGEPLYQEHCASCHGADLRGTDKGPSHLSVVYEPGHHGDIAFVLAARNGVRAHHWTFGDMEPVDGLSDADLEAIVAFVREQQRINGFEPYPPK